MPAHQRNVGYVFQDSNLFSHLNVRNNLLFGKRRSNSTSPKFDFHDIVERLRLGTLLKRQTSGLSGGEKQRVALGRALLSEPDWLLLDEPLASLDQNGRSELLQHLENIRDELDIPMLYVSHALDEVARLADSMALMQQGKLLAIDTACEIFTRLDLPLAHSDDALSIISARMASYDDHYGLATFQFPGGTLQVPSSGNNMGRVLRLKVHARDVSLSLTPQSGSSILNTLPVTVQDFSTATRHPSRITVRLDAQGNPLLAFVTRKSADILGLRKGLNLHAQLKSSALLIS